MIFLLTEKCAVNISFLLPLLSESVKNWDKDYGSKIKILNYDIVYSEYLIVKKY